MPQIRCTHCGQTYDLTPEQAPQYAGQTITCTNCQKPFLVPPSSPSMPAAMPPLPVSPVTYETPHFNQPQRANGLAIASLVSGIIGIIVPVIPGLLAIALGIFGLRKTRDRSVGGKGLAIAGIAVGATSLLLSGCLISILLPSLNRARETANRIKCASNMRQIGQGLLLYANDNHGQYPPRLEELLLSEGLQSEVFVCPSSNDTPASGGTPQQQAAALSTGGHESYIYVPNLTNLSSADTIVLYEPLIDHRNDGINILFGDGHVEFLRRGTANGMIAELKAGYNPPRRGHY